MERNIPHISTYTITSASLLVYSPPKSSRDIHVSFINDSPETVYIHFSGPQVPMDNAVPL